MDLISPTQCHSTTARIVLYIIVFATLASAIPINFPNRNFANASSATDLAATQILDQPFPYEFPKKDVPVNLFPMPNCAGVTLEEATIDQLQDAMNQGLLTTSQIVLCYLQRIYQTDMYLGYVHLAITSRIDSIFQLHSRS